MGSLRPRLRGRPVLFAACALLTSCAADRTGGAGGSAPAGTPLEIDRSPRLSVGVIEGDTLQELDRVRTPFLRSDGSLAVPLAGPRVIRLFGPDGAFVRSLGGRGEGPGEFEDLNAAWARGDTIEAFDSRTRRVTRFLPDGATDVVTLHSAPRSVDVAVPGVLPDGWVVMGVEVGGYRGSPVERDQIVADRFAPDGAYVGEVARTEGFIRFRHPGLTGPEPLSPRSWFALHGGNVYVAESLTPKIQVWDPDGTVQREITWEADAPLPPKEVLRLVVDSAVARAEPDRARATRQRLEAAVVPDRLSVFWGFLVDEEGFVWVRPFEPLLHAAALGGLAATGPGGEWLVFSPEGVRVGSVRVPDELEPVQITSDAVVGIRRDELGVESVRVHSLRRR